MSKKKLITILIFTFFTIRIVLNLLANILLMLIQPNFDQYAQQIQIMNYGQLVENPVLQVLSFTLIASFISPVLEELVYRSWLTKKMNFAKSTFFLIFLFILGEQLVSFTPLGRPLYNLFQYLTTSYINFFTNIYPPVTYSIFNTGKMSVLALFFPIFVMFTYLLNYISIKTKIKLFVTRLELFLNSFSSRLLIIFSAIIFYASHNKDFLINADGVENIAYSIGSIFVLVVGLMLGYIVRHYSLRLCIFLHILVNFTSSMRFYQNLQPVIAIILYTTYFVIFIFLLYSIFKEINKLNLQVKDLELTRI
jgi:membrane protease YdiL (CAAX protease family)